MPTSTKLMIPGIFSEHTDCVSIDWAGMHTSQFCKYCLRASTERISVLTKQEDTRMKQPLGIRGTEVSPDKFRILMVKDVSSPNLTEKSKNQIT